jgi:hypothetical protein
LSNVMKGSIGLSVVDVCELGDSNYGQPAYH